MNVSSFNFEIFPLPHAKEEENQMYFAITTAKRIMVMGLAHVVALTSYIATAAGLPDLMRILQKGVSALLDLIETLFSIPSKYMVWFDAAGADAVLIYALFYIGSFIAILITWTLTKRLLITIGRGLRWLLLGTKKTPKPSV
jgi:hypothetical protein